LLFKFLNLFTSFPFTFSSWKHYFISLSLFVLLYCELWCDGYTMYKSKCRCRFWSTL